MKKIFDDLEIWFRTIFYYFQRTGFELLLLFFIGMVLFVFSKEIVEYDETGRVIRKYCIIFGYQFMLPPAFQLFLFKIANFSASQIHAFMVRKWLFPYIDLSKEVRAPHIYLALALHVSAAYLYAVGG